MRDSFAAWPRARSEGKIAPVTEPSSAAASREWLRPALVRSWGEFILVAAATLALFIRNSTVAALHGSSGHFMQTILADSRLGWYIVIESLLLAAFLLYLHWRGWKPADLRIRVGWLTTIAGLGLFLFCQVAVTFVIIALFTLLFMTQTTSHTFTGFLARMVPHIPPHSLHVSWLAIIVAMIVNAFLEEITCMGYLFNQLAARRGPVVALIVTVFLRVSCHTYQDPVHLAGIAMLFTIYAAFYWYVRKLWPLIFAHLTLDIVSMSVLKFIFS